MFTLTGILADEEPKTPVSASGNYNTSNYPAPSTSILSDVLWSGRSEFTVMCWVSLDTGATSEIIYMEDFLSSYFTVDNDGFYVRIKNSSGGVTTENITGLTNNANEFYHWTVTGSVSNNRLRVYRNGVLLGSSVMTYANATFTEARVQNDNFNLAQFNFYDRELTEAEVAEHYVVIDAQVGVLGYDAMTPAQQSGLIYSTSFIDDISYDGNEFKDRSSSNISISWKPPLTGQQIYVYTALSETFSANIGGLDGVNDKMTADTTDSGIGTQDYSLQAKFKTTNSSFQFILTQFKPSQSTNGIWAIAMNNGKIRVEHRSAPENSNYYIVETTNTYNDGNLHDVIPFIDQTNQTIYIMIDGTNVALDSPVTAGNPWAGLTTNGTYTVGDRDIFSSPFNGSVAFTGVALGDLRSVHSELFPSSTKATCWDKLQTSTQNMYLRHQEIAKYNGRSDAQALADNVGTFSNLTLVNGATITDSGLDVIC